MNTREAEELGFEFTGATWDTWRDKPEYIEKRKAEAREIKKRITGADFKIVRGKKSDWLGSSTTYAIMGNIVFNTFGDNFRLKSTENRVNSYANDRAEVEARFKKELEDLELKHNKDLEFLKEYKNLLK